MSLRGMCGRGGEVLFGHKIRVRSVGERRQLSLRVIEVSGGGKYEACKQSL